MSEKNYYSDRAPIVVEHYDPNCVDGGDNPTCHGHGTCAPSTLPYTCSCSGNWNVDTNCGTCISGWEGPSCNTRGGNGGGKKGDNGGGMSWLWIALIALVILAGVVGAVFFFRRRKKGKKLSSFF